MAFLRFEHTIDVVEVVVVVAGAHSYNIRKYREYIHIVIFIIERMLKKLIE